MRPLTDEEPTREFFEVSDISSNVIFRKLNVNSVGEVEDLGSMNWRDLNGFIFFENGADHPLEVGALGVERHLANYSGRR